MAEPFEWSRDISVRSFLETTRYKLAELRDRHGWLQRLHFLKDILQRATQLHQAEPNARIKGDGTVVIYDLDSAAAGNPPLSRWSSVLFFDDLEDPFERDWDFPDLVASHLMEDAVQSSGLSVDFDTLRIIDEQPEEASSDSSEDAPTARSYAAEAHALSNIGEENAQQPEQFEQAHAVPLRDDSSWLPPFQHVPPGEPSDEFFPSSDESGEDSEEVALPDVSPGADVDELFSCDVTADL
ncbi:hypothetical protein MTO96_017108 [Rhipicephalus appendiculatus]